MNEDQADLQDAMNALKEAKAEGTVPWEAVKTDLKLGDGVAIAGKLRIYLEFLFHYKCLACNQHFSVGDIWPTPEKTVWCTHCGTAHQTPGEVELGDRSIQSLNQLAPITAINAESSQSKTP